MQNRRTREQESADVEQRLQGFELAERISRVGHWRWTIASDELFWSDEVFRIHGHAPGAFRPDVRRAVGFYHPDDQAVVDGHLQRAIDEHRDFEFELRVLRSNGSIRDVLSSGFCELDAAGAVQALFGTFQDVTELRQAERDHAVVRRRLQLAADSAGLGVWDLDLVGRELSWDPRMLEMYGLDPRQRTGAVDDWIEALHPEDRPRAVASFEAAIAGEADFDLRFRIVRRSDGAVRHMQASAVVERDGEGRPLRMVGINQDVTERARAELRFRAALDHLAVATLICRADGQVEFANEAAGALFGAAAPRTLQGRDLGELLGRDALGTGADPRPEQLGFDRRVRRLDGSSFPAHVGTGELDGPEGRRLVVSIQDLSTLRELEQQLGHAQRMEAVGQLAGGIAHDFNNLLGVLAGHADLMEDDIGDDPELHESLDAIRHAVERGASLTKRLLAYSRKQTLSPTVVDAAVVVRELGELLRRTLGETVELQLEAPTGPSRVRVDRHQLEDALLNLALNAGHAMPEGGRLTISVAGNAPMPAADGVGTAGPCVRLTVRDTGVGMTPEVRERVFEPFFTTRDVGEGTGLGLSMVYGFVRQSGGQVTLESDVGVGTAVFLHLPQVDEGPTEEQEPESESTAPTEPEPAVVLLVEDDPDVRGVARRLLERAGYGILEAADAAAALQWLRSASRIDLLFTDVTLPRGVSGPEIAREAETLRPGLPVLFTTGYALEGRRPEALPPGDAPVLRKPFTRDRLLAAVAERLESGAAAPAPG